MTLLLSSSAESDSFGSKEFDSAHLNLKCSKMSLRLKQLYNPFILSRENLDPKIIVAMQTIIL